MKYNKKSKEFTISLLKSLNDKSWLKLRKKIYSGIFDTFQYFFHNYFNLFALLLFPFLSLQMWKYYRYYMKYSLQINLKMYRMNIIAMRNKNRRKIEYSFTSKVLSIICSLCFCNNLFSMNQYLSIYLFFRESSFAFESADLCI